MKKSDRQVSSRIWPIEGFRTRLSDVALTTLINFGSNPWPAKNHPFRKSSILAALQIIKIKLSFSISNKETPSSSPGLHFICNFNYITEVPIPSPRHLLSRPRKLWKNYDNPDTTDSRLNPVLKGCNKIWLEKYQKIFLRLYFYISIS